MLNTDALTLLDIDAEEGLAYCADDPDFYEEMLLEYLNESAGRLAELEQFYAARNWDRYAICAHSVKSSSRMIGAKGPAEFARELEMAAKEGNETLLLSGHDRFLTEYRSLTEKLRGLLQTAG